MTQATDSAPPVTDPRWRSHQLAVFWLLWSAYASYDLRRVNFAVALPAVLREFPSWTSAQIGSIPLTYAAVYAIGGIVNGTLGQICGTRRLMTVALGAILSGAGIAYLKDPGHGNWSLVLWVLMAMPLLPAALLTSIWNASRKGAK